MLALYQEVKGLLKQRIIWTGHQQTLHTLVSMMLGVLVCRDVRLGHIAMKGGLSGQLESIEQGSLLPFRGQVRLLHDWLYVQDEFYRVNFVLTCADESADPWLLATHLPPTKRVIAEYKRRFGCEEFFSDMKARGFDVEPSRLCHAQRFDRLLIVIVLLSYWLWGIARRLFVTGQIAHLVGASHRHRYSYFQLA